MGQQIKINEFFVTIHVQLPTNITVVEIGEECIASGGFGLIYECISINGVQPSTPLLIKLLKVDKEAVSVVGHSVIVKLQKKMKTFFSSTSTRAFKTQYELPTLKAFPGFSFSGEIDGKKVWGYSTSNLCQLGFSSLSDFLNGTEIEQKEFKNLSFHKRFQFCFHLASGFNFLSSLNYVHADINPKNIFINTVSGELAIIDYDGGGILDQALDDTLTHGNLEDSEWLAPEIYEKLETNQDLKVDRYSDMWSVSVAFHYLLFGYDPFFFIQEQSKRCKEDYLNVSKFYPINVSDPNVSENVVFVIDSYYTNIKTEIPTTIHEALVRTYTEGFFNPHQRTPYLLWMELFKQTQSAPIIEYFNVNKDFAFKGTQVNLSWKVNDAIELTIDNQIGDVTGKSEITTRPEQSMTYWLNARGHFGLAKKPAEVNVFPVPLLEYLKVPTPNFESSVIIPEIVIEFPVINLSIELDKSKSTQTPTVFISLSNDFTNMQRVYKKGSALGSVSYIFNKIKQAIISN